MSDLSATPINKIQRRLRAVFFYLRIKNIWLRLLFTAVLSPSLSLFAQKPDSLVHLMFAGDVTLANHFENHVGYDLSYPFKYLDWFGQADISMVNLENPLTRRGKPADKLFTFRTKPEYVHILQAAGIDIVTLANNHIYDYGAQGLYDTIRILDKGGIRHVGAGGTLPEARRPVVFRKKGLRLAYLAYYGLGRHSDSHPATEDSAGTALRNLNYIREDIQQIREQVDVVIINFHWGIEKENYPQPDQRAFAHAVIDAGADFIIGHHPHVLQGIEKYKGKLIAYSLGNFIFGGNSRRYERSIVLEILINPKNAGEYRVRVHPVEIKNWQPAAAGQEVRKKVVEDLRQFSSVFPSSFQLKAD